MTGKSRAYRFLILVIAAFVIAGCSSPVGSIGERNTGSIGGGNDGLVVTAKQRSYNFGEVFLPSHLEVTRNGVTVPISDCTVYIEDPSYKEVTAAGYPLFSSGVKRILVRTNNNLTGETSIRVSAPGTGGSGNNSSPGIHIEGPF